MFKPVVLALMLGAIIAPRQAKAANSYWSEDSLKARCPNSWRSTHDMLDDVERLRPHGVCIVGLERRVGGIFHTMLADPTDMKLDENGRIKCWVRNYANSWDLELKRDSLATIFHDDAWRNYERSMEQIVFDCSARTAAFGVREIFYDMDGKVLMDLSSKDAPVLEDLVPGSVGADEIEKLCSLFLDHHRPKTRRKRAK